MSVWSWAQAYIASSSVTIVIAKVQFFVLPDGYLHLGSFMFSIIAFSEHFTALIVSIYTTFKWVILYLVAVQPNAEYWEGRVHFLMQVTIC